MRSMRASMDRPAELRRRLLRATALAGAVGLLATTVQAQTASPPSGDAALEEVVVTASRVTREGYSAPTPTTVIGAEQIRAAAPANIADFVNQQPALVGSQTRRIGNTSAASTVGANLFNLRQLGANRTLVLLDGHRVAPSTLTANIDTNLLPQALVERVDIVTGGASAAWGSDAVAGVVNYVLNKNLTGFRGHIQGGTTEEGDAHTFGIEASFGVKLAEGRGHILLSGEHHKEGAGDPVTSRDWFKSYKVVNNPAFAPGNGQPARLVVPGVGLGVATDGGLITGPATVTVGGRPVANPLRGLQFGPGGTPKPFSFGNTSGVLSWGGDAQDVSQIIRLATPVEINTLYGRGSFELTPQITAYAEASYAEAKGKIFARVFERDANINVRSDNAYLDAGVRAQMQQRGLSTIQVGRFFTDFGPLVGRNDREQQRYVVGLEGAFGDGWTWDAYYQYGKTDFTTGDHTNNPITARFNAAADAVRNPAGQIVCRSTLTNPTDGCLPLNIFGAGSGSPASWAWITAEHALQTLTIKQQVAAASLRGEPFALPAGPVSMAAGVEYRKEEYAATADPLSPGNAFFVGNFRASKGQYEVTEGFLEVVVPLVKDLPLTKAVDLNGAVRLTDYSVSGSVTSWKAGATWDLTDELRLRGTLSRDIRAPNLNELYQGGLTINQTINDPVTRSSYSIIQTSAGNLDLKPEKADTTAFGAVYRPHWLPGFGASVDYFDIKINDAIFTQVSQAVIDQCAAGVTPQCPYVTRNAAGVITTVVLVPLNVNSEGTKGVDFEFSYAKPLEDLVAGWSGDLRLRAVGTYVKTRYVTANGIKTEYAGSNANFDTNSQATPEWRWLVSGTYERGPFSTQLTARYIGAGKLNPAWGPLDIDHNHVPSRTYFDLMAAYRFKVAGADAQIYGVVQNLFDKDPPIAPIYGSSGFLGTGTNGFLYDTLGRQFRTGLRLNF